MKRKEPQYYDEAQAIRDLAQEDPDVAAGAFLEVYERYHRAIYRATKRRLKSTDASKDVVLEVFEWLWDNRRKIGYITGLKNYLHVVARNHVFHQFKKLAAFESAATEFSERVRLAEDNDSEVKYERLLKTASELPDRQREIFELAKIHGLSHEAIAKRLSISPKTVNNHITEALKYIRKHTKLTVSSLIILALCLTLLR